jgi:hypothetical protein
MDQTSCRGRSDQLVWALLPLPMNISPGGTSSGQVHPGLAWQLESLQTSPRQEKNNNYVWERGFGFGDKTRNIKVFLRLGRPQSVWTSIFIGWGGHPPVELVRNLPNLLLLVSVQVGYNSHRSEQYGQLVRLISPIVEQGQTGMPNRSARCHIWSQF